MNPSKQGNPCSITRLASGRCTWPAWIMAISLLTCVLASLLRGAYQTDGSTRFYQCQIEPRENENFAFADIQCWLPHPGEPVSGILCIVLHPHGSGGVRFDNPKPWIELASRFHVGLLSISFAGRDREVIPWCRASGGSGRALIEAIDAIAAESGASSLRTCPLVLAGICEAGQFAYEFSAFAPGRTAAFLTMGGGKHDLMLAAKASAVPGLLVAATDRGEYPVTNMNELFEIGRMYSAPWFYSAEPIAEYDKGHSSSTAIEYLGSVLRRLHTIDSAARSPGIPSNQGALSISNASQPDLSFVSDPLPESGSVNPTVADMGAILLKSGYGTVKFDVQCRSGAGIDGVEVVDPPKGVNCRAINVGGNRWQIDCRLEPHYFPCGPFRTEIPIRFMCNGEAVPGGINAVADGRIVGDIHVEPKSIGLDQPIGTPDQEDVRLKSVSGSPIEILDIQSTYPAWATAEVQKRSGPSIDLRCDLSPPPELRRTGFSGYYYIRARSSDIETLKVPFYGLAYAEYQ